VIQQSPPDEAVVQRTLVITFDESESTIEVVSGRKETFRVDADEDRAYITFDGKEISADEFSRAALEDALFKPPKPNVRYEPTVGGWMA